MARLSPHAQATAPRALILAAGRGERMRPLTDTTPKPLLPVCGKPLIEWHLWALARAGVREVVINTAWLEDQFPAALGDGSRWHLRITYSHEGREFGGALETAGGIATALPLLAPNGDEPFWVVSGDIHAPQFTFDATHLDAFANSQDQGLLWMVPNPAFHPRGDFLLDQVGRLHRLDAAIEDRPQALTYANFALLRPTIVQGVAPGTRAPLGPCLHAAADAGRLAGVRWEGAWENVGTPAQLAALTKPA
jgi:MurNAc alpha-1-phosphate uridylyltransferase